jgi:16S rRNA G966 N2-methylase RsmD
VKDVRKEGKTSLEGLWRAAASSDATVLVVEEESLSNPNFVAYATRLGFVILSRDVYASPKVMDKILATKWSCKLVEDSQVRRECLEFSENGYYVRSLLYKWTKQRDRVVISLGDRWESVWTAEDVGIETVMHFGDYPENELIDDVTTIQKELIVVGESRDYLFQNRFSSRYATHPTISARVFRDLRNFFEISYMEELYGGVGVDTVNAAAQGISVAVFEEDSERAKIIGLQASLAGVSDLVLVRQKELMSSFRGCAVLYESEYEWRPKGTVEEIMATSGAICVTSRVMDKKARHLRKVFDSLKVAETLGPGDFVVVDMSPEGRVQLSEMKWEPNLAPGAFDLVYFDPPWDEYFDWRKYQTLMAKMHRKLKHSLVLVKAPRDVDIDVGEPVCRWESDKVQFVLLSAVGSTRYKDRITEEYVSRGFCFGDLNLQSYKIRNLSFLAEPSFQRLSDWLEMARMCEGISDDFVYEKCSDVVGMPVIYGPGREFRPTHFLKRLVGTGPCVVVESEKVNLSTVRDMANPSLGYCHFTIGGDDVLMVSEEDSKRALNFVTSPSMRQRSLPLSYENVRDPSLLDYVHERRNYPLRNHNFLAHSVEDFVFFGSRVFMKTSDSGVNMGVIVDILRSNGLLSSPEVIVKMNKRRALKKVRRANLMNVKIPDGSLPVALFSLSNIQNSYSGAFNKAVEIASKGGVVTLPSSSVARILDGSFGIKVHGRTMVQNIDGFEYRDHLFDPNEFTAMGFAVTTLTDVHKLVEDGHELMGHTYMCPRHVSSELWFCVGKSIAVPQDIHSSDTHRIKRLTNLIRRFSGGSLDSLHFDRVTSVVEFGGFPLAREGGQVHGYLARGDGRYFVSVAGHLVGMLLRSSFTTVDVIGYVNQILFNIVESESNFPNPEVGSGLWHSHVEFILAISATEKLMAKNHLQFCRGVFEEIGKKLDVFLTLHPRFSGNSFASQKYVASLRKRERERLQLIEYW